MTAKNTEPLQRNKRNPDTEKAYSPKELAEITGHHLNSIYNWIHRSNPALECTFAGGKIEITLAQLEAFKAAVTAAKFAKKRGAK